MSTVSHELRTPLTSIIGSLDNVNRPELALPRPLPSSSSPRPDARRVGLQRLIDDLRVVSRIDREQSRSISEPVSLKLAFEEVNRVDSIEPTFTIEPPDLTVEADHDHLTRIPDQPGGERAKYAVGKPMELSTPGSVPTRR